MMFKFSFITEAGNGSNDEDLNCVTENGSDLFNCCRCKLSQSVSCNPKENLAKPKECKPMGHAPMTG